MNLPKMKNAFLFLLLFSSFCLNAQIPDSLDVELPWEIVRTPKCMATMGEGPRSNNDNIYIALHSDTSYFDENNYCGLRIKTWAILDWTSSILYEFRQIADTYPEAYTVCENNFYVQYQDLPMILTPSDLLSDPNPAHTYAYDFADPGAQSIIVDEDSENNFAMYVYDFTDSTVCKSNVFVTKCEDDIELIFPELVEIEFAGEPYIELTLDMLGVSIEYPCGTYTSKIKVGGQTNALLYSNTVGEKVLVNVEINFSDGTKYKKSVNVKATGIKPDPKVLFIEEKDFSAGETIELEVWSEGIPDLIAWQLKLEFENAELISLENSEQFDYVPSNIQNDGSEIKCLWSSANALSLDAQTDATWFTLVVKSNIAGNTFDIFNTNLDYFSSIIVEDDDYLYEYPVEFSFNVAPRDFLNSNVELNKSEIKVFPNPVFDVISVSGLATSISSTEIEIIDLEGKTCLQRKIAKLDENSEIDISELPSGMFILKMINGNDIHTQKIIKI